MTEENVILTPQAYKTLKELSDLSVRAANDPKTRKKFVGIVKELDPSKRFPDVENDDLREEFERQRAADKQEREQEKALAKIEAQKESLRSRYDDAAIGEIEKLMEKHGIGDYDVAARLYAAETTAAKPTYEINDHKWNLPKVDPKDFGNMKQNSRALAYQAIDDIKRKRAS